MNDTVEINNDLFHCNNNEDNQLEINATENNDSNETSSKKLNKKEGLRKGKWTLEEENYTNKVIKAFNAGVLRMSDAERGTTLRVYLSKKLNCDPMRITKKFTGASCLGKRVYHAVKEGIRQEDVDSAMAELHMLEMEFRKKLAQMNNKNGANGNSDQDHTHLISTPAIDALVKQSQANMKPPCGAPMWNTTGMYPTQFAYPGSYGPPMAQHQLPVFNNGEMPPPMSHNPQYHHQYGNGNLHFNQPPREYHQGYHHSNSPYQMNTGRHFLHNQQQVIPNQSRPMPYFQDYGLYGQNIAGVSSRETSGSVTSSEAQSTDDRSESGNEDIGNLSMSKSLKRPHPDFGRQLLVGAATHATQFPPPPQLLRCNHPSSSYEHPNTVKCPPPLDDSCALSETKSEPIVVKILNKSNGSNSPQSSAVPSCDNSVDERSVTKRVKVAERDASSLLGFFTELRRNSSQEDLLEFCEGVQKSVASNTSPSKDCADNNDSTTVIATPVSV